MKRFWNEVALEREDDLWTIHLDGRPVRTPARALLGVSSKALGEAIADEWRAVREKIDPREMPLTGLANAAIDRITPERQAFAKSLAKYGEADLACYRVEGPHELVSRQEQEWDKLLGWARRRFDVDFSTTTGLLHVAQPEATVERLSYVVAALDPFRLAGLSPLVTIGGSLLAGLAILERAIDPNEAWNAVSLEDRWQLEQWGIDAEAEAALENRRRDFLAAARFVSLLD